MSGGIRFGQYVLLRRIARGGMAEVFLAQQHGLEGFDRRVAVKRILPHLADAPDFVKMFLGEAKLAAQLSHPNVVHIYDFGKVDGDYFIAMEYVDGVHAGQLFKYDRERLPPTLVARIGADAAAALHYAHELKSNHGKPLDLVHRDVSPANIMVSFDGIVKLCDFGIAKAAMMSDQRTNPGQVKGKYAYMSPEQTIASQLDGRSDVFSLSIVLWELLAGRTIVSRGDAVDAMRAIRDGKLMPIERAVPNIPSTLGQAITWGLQVKREQRATAAELAQALEAFIKSSPELATPMQLGAWVRARFVRDMTGEGPSLSSTAETPNTGMQQGTLGAPGTSVAPGTAIGLDTPESVAPSTTVNIDTPVSLIAASRISDPSFDDSETVAVGPPHMTADNRPTIVDPRPHDAISRSIERAKRMVAFAPDEPTGRDPMKAPPGPDPDPTKPRLGPDAETMKPTHRAVVEGSLRPLERKLPDSGIRRRPTTPPSFGTVGRATPTHYESTADVRGKRIPRRIVVVAVLALLAVASFLIVLATHGPARSVPPPADAPELASIPVDAAPPPDASPDAAIDAPAPALDAADAPTTLLEVHTRPEGATIKVGDQTRTAPAQLALPAGHYVVVAELPGYKPERREIDLPYGEHMLHEIVFGTRVIDHKQPVGKLTARTTPYSEVFLGGKKLGETPFADLELAPGTYTLTFKNPERPAVTRKVTITAGKTTKLFFSL